MPTLVLKAKSRYPPHFMCGIEAKNAKVARYPVSDNIWQGYADRLPYQAPSALSPDLGELNDCLLKKTAMGGTQQKIGNGPAQFFGSCLISVNDLSPIPWPDLEKDQFVGCYRVANNPVHTLAQVDSLAEA
ncbi:hypothetical protein B0H17DRAFT_1140797 [Mycena rosella]|uniref:Uncharacterized protein n=1 Tax=Mycena rosella TaxID=1033263 RepID=A0AAD7GAW7_MYCRO|nr:hypothetical protein B0H17DRAFT_1140797 [Mycena rosella]